MSVDVRSKLFTSDGRGLPVSLKVKIDGCSDHGSNDDILARAWEETLRADYPNSTTETCHYSAEICIDFSYLYENYFFVLGERRRPSGGRPICEQNLYAIQAQSPGATKSLGAIKTDLLKYESFESSDEITLGPTAVVKKVPNRLILCNNSQMPAREEHYRPGSIFHILQASPHTDAAMPACSTDQLVDSCGDNLVALCVDTGEAANQPVGMRRADNTIAMPLPQQSVCQNAVGKNLFVPVEVGNELLHHQKEAKASPEQDSLEIFYTHSQSEFNPSEERGDSFSSPSDDTEIRLDNAEMPVTNNVEVSSSEGIVFAATPTVSDGEPSFQDYGEQSDPSVPFHRDQSHFKFDNNVGGYPESSTIAEVEVFEQEVPPTPVDHVNKGRIHDAICSQVNAEPVEEKSVSAESSKHMAETGVALPLKTCAEQQQAKTVEDALVIPSMVPGNQVRTARPQQFNESGQVPGINAATCYTYSNLPSINASAQNGCTSNHQRLASRLYSYGGTGLEPQLPRPSHLPAPSHPAVLSHRQNSVSVSSAQRPQKQTNFQNLAPFYPLTPPGKIIYSNHPKFQKGTFVDTNLLEQSSVDLGSGGNGSVSVYYHKSFHKRSCFAAKMTEYRASELELWAHFEHPNIVSLLAVAIKEYSPKARMCWQIMPKLDNDLSTLVDYNTLISIRSSQLSHKWDTALANFKHILRETLKGLDYLHCRGLVHRDIKERNVFYKMRCEHGIPYECLCAAQQKCIVQIGDFDALVCTRIDTPHHQIGTKHYRPPEMLARGKLNANIDIYSFGCMVIKLADGRQNHNTEVQSIVKVLPSPDGSQNIQELLNMKLKLVNILTSGHHEINAIGKFVKLCVHDLPEERCSAAALLKDPYLN